MGSTVEYVDASHVHAARYARNSKAVGVLWAIFTVCHFIIALVAFLTPDWLGDSEGEYPARFGLWSACTTTTDAGETCDGHLADFSELPSGVFQLATVFVGAAVVASAFAILAMLLFFFCPSTAVFHICGWLQLVSAVTMATGALCHPLGWGAPAVRRACGPSAGAYAPGACSPRWALALALAGACDALALAGLAFVLATRHVKLQADDGIYNRPGSVYKGEINNAYITDAASVTESRKSLNLHPVLLVSRGPPPSGVPMGGPPRPHHGMVAVPSQAIMDDACSQFSARYQYGQNNNGGSSIHNFQL